METINFDKKVDMRFFIPFAIHPNFKKMMYQIFDQAIENYRLSCSEKDAEKKSKKFRFMAWEEIKAPLETLILDLSEKEAHINSLLTMQTLLEIKSELYWWEWSLIFQINRQLTRICDQQISFREFLATTDAWMRFVTKEQPEFTLIRQFKEAAKSYIPSPV